MNDLDWEGRVHGTMLRKFDKLLEFDKFSFAILVMYQDMSIKISEFMICSEQTLRGEVIRSKIEICPATQKYKGQKVQIARLCMKMVSAHLESFS